MYRVPIASDLQRITIQLADLGTWHGKRHPDERTTTRGHWKAFDQREMVAAAPTPDPR
jgi:hypothetical protein